jgi:hypothetical protein
MGNIRFVGTLLNNKMVASQVIIQITTELLTPVRPEALERLSAFLQKVGPTFDHESWPYHAQFREVFRKVQELSKSDSVEKRVRCLLIDVVDLRKAAWQDEKVVTKKDEGPMTLEQVHQKAREMERDSMLRQSPKGDRSGTMNRGSNDWSKVPNRGSVGSNSSSWDVQGSRKTYTNSNSQQGSRQGSRQGSQTGSPREPAGKLREFSQKASPVQPAKVPKESYRNSLKATVKELSLSHDKAEALLRVKELQIPQENQAKELSHLLQYASEEAKPEVRAVCFQFVVQILLDQIFHSSEILRGLRKFFKNYQELSLDMPTLPMIMRDEFLPALSELVQAGLMSEDDVEELAKVL